jgi:hypothetical protein
MGCGELNPYGPGKDEASRRVVVMVFTPEHAPRDLPCTVGDLTPCLDSCRPQPRGEGGPPPPPFRCAVFRRLAATCACGQRPTPRVITFRYGFEVDPADGWSAGAAVTLTDDQGAARSSQPLAAGEVHGRTRVFTFQVERDVRYRADLRDGDVVLPLFGLTALHDLADEDGPTEHVAPIDRDPASPALDEVVEDHGLLRIRLYDQAGQLLPSTQYRLTIAGQVFAGFAEDGWASAPLPPACPTSCTIAWGPADANGDLPFHAEVALDCHGEDSLSSMLHNLGYPRRLPLDTRVRAFQKAERVPERGLTKTGEVPPLTRKRIVQRYEARIRA